jgi:hypothetical protein
LTNDSPAPVRDMTLDERRMARALGRCVFLPGTCDKRFALQMKTRAEELRPRISVRIAKLLREKVIMYRRQIPADVVALAQRDERSPMSAHSLPSAS